MKKYISISVIVILLAITSSSPTYGGLYDEGTFFNPGLKICLGNNGFNFGLEVSRGWLNYDYVFNGGVFGIQFLNGGSLYLEYQFGIIGFGTSAGVHMRIDEKKENMEFSPRLRLFGGYADYDYGNFLSLAASPMFNNYQIEGISKLVYSKDVPSPK